MATFVKKALPVSRVTQMSRAPCSRLTPFGWMEALVKYILSCVCVTLAGIVSAKQQNKTPLRTQSKSARSSHRSALLNERESSSCERVRIRVRRDSLYYGANIVTHLWSIARQLITTHSLVH